MMDKLKTRIKNMMARGIVQLLEGSSYQVTLLEGETVSNLEHLQEFGFTSRKPSTSQAVGICIFYGGNRANGSLLVLEVPELKPVIEDGESIVYNAFGTKITLTKANKIVQTADIIELRGTGNDGLVKIKELTEKLNKLTAEVRAHTHNYFIPGIGNGVTTAPITTITDFNKTHYENTKVVHNG